MSYFISKRSLLNFGVHTLSN